MTDTQGPYQPTWTNRRKVVFVYLGVSGLDLNMAWAGVITMPESIQHAVLAVNAIVLTYYLIGPSWEGVKAFTAWKKG